MTNKPQKQKKLFYNYYDWDLVKGWQIIGTK